MTIRYMTICYAGLLADFDDPSAAMIALAPEIAAHKAKDEKRRLSSETATASQLATHAAGHDLPKRRRSRARRSAEWIKPHG